MRVRLISSCLSCLLLLGCDLAENRSYQNKDVQGADAIRGRVLLASGAHGCIACHFIPGAGSIKGAVGPPLAGFARRGFIAGRLPNQPEVLIAFLQNPPALVPMTGMPDVGLTHSEARDISAYLYTLEQPDAL